MQKILVIGCGGAGKTTFSKRLGARLGIPVLHLDSYFWKPGWEAMESSEWRNQVDQLIQTPSWIMDGNYGGTLKPRIEACDTIIFLDMPRWRCLSNVIKRRIQFSGTNRPEMTKGNTERLNMAFLYWIWTYNRRRRPGIMERLNAVTNHKHVIILRSYKEVQAFLSDPSHVTRNT